MTYSLKWHSQVSAAGSSISEEGRNRARACVVPPENEPDDHHAHRLAIKGPQAVERPVVTTSLVEDCARLYFEVGHERANYTALLQVVRLIADRLGVSEINSDRARR